MEREADAEKSGEGEENKCQGACHRQVEATNHVRITDAESSRSVNAPVLPLRGPARYLGPDPRPEGRGLFICSPYGDCDTPAHQITVSPPDPDHYGQIRSNPTTGEFQIYEPIADLSHLHAS